MEQLLEKLLGLDPAASSGITLVLLAAIVFYIIRMMNRSQTRASENQTQWINLITTTQAQFNTMSKRHEGSFATIGENVKAHTEALKTFTRAIATSIGELESTLITLTEQGLRHHADLMKSQTDTRDGLDGLKTELTALTSQIKELTSTIIEKSGITSDSHVKLDTAISQLNTITQTLERIKPHENQKDSSTSILASVDSPVGISGKSEGH